MDGGSSSLTLRYKSYSITHQLISIQQPVSLASRLGKKFSKMRVDISELIHAFINRITSKHDNNLSDCQCLIWLACLKTEVAIYSRTSHPECDVRGERLPCEYYPWHVQVFQWLRCCSHFYFFNKMIIIALIPTCGQQTVRLSGIPYYKGLFFIHSLEADRMRFLNWDKISSNAVWGLIWIRLPLIWKVLGSLLTHSCLFFSGNG